MQPFVPNPSFMYLSPKHQNALTYLEYGLMESIGFILLTGEVGSGKTTLIKYILSQVETQQEVAVIFNTNVSSEQLIDLIISEFDLKPAKGGKSSSLDVLYQYLIKCFSLNKKVLLIIDEAQNLSREALEEVRMLSNLQSDDQILLQIILVGQPEIRDRLKKPDMVQFNQRISVAYHLHALTREETGAYITFRLEKAGGMPDIFTNEAIDLIYQASSGIPRTINILCDSALVYGFADELKVIDASEIEVVLHDRDGMGLSTFVQEIAGNKVDESAGIEKVQALEERVARIEARIDLQVEGLEKSAVALKDDLVKEMKNLYALERKKNDKLIFEYSKIKEKYLALEEKTKGEKHDPAVEGEELVVKMKKIIHMEREGGT